MSAVLVSPPRVSEETSLEALLSHVMRDAGWIMMGGSAQFRHGALSALQASIRRLPELGVSQHVLHLSRLLGEKAILVATRGAAHVESLLGLQRTLAEFERAMRTDMALFARR